MTELKKRFGIEEQQAEGKVPAEGKKRRPKRARKNDQHDDPAADARAKALARQMVVVEAYDAIDEAPEERTEAPF